MFENGGGEWLLVQGQNTPMGRPKKHYVLGQYGT